MNRRFLEIAPISLHPWSVLRMSLAMAIALNQWVLVGFLLALLEFVREAVRSIVTIDDNLGFFTI